MSLITAAQTQLGADIYGEASGDKSCYSVSMSSDGPRVAIGAPHNDARGHVRVYEYSGGTWTQLGSDIDAEAPSDQSGHSVSMSSDGTRVAIGAPRNDGNNPPHSASSGHVRVYEYSGGTWTQLGADIDGETINDLSGTSVSLSSDGTRVAIGAPQHDISSAVAGHVRVYEYSGGTWTQLGADIDGETGSDQSGHSVSLSSDGTRVAIGSVYNSENGSRSGHVRVYEYGGGTWSQLGFDIDGEAEEDDSGNSVSLSSDGTRVAIGAPFNDGNGTRSGHVRVYEYSGGTWTQLGADIDGEAAEDVSGYSVSLSSDGTRVAIGAPVNSGYSGHVRLYEYSGGTWNQVGSDIDGEASGDVSGVSVSLSSDGTKVAIGAFQNSGNGNGSGHVRVYSINTLSTNNFELASENIQLYPNPTEKYISLSNLKKQQNYTIYNVLGAQVKKGTISNIENIDVRYFLKGMYLLKLDNGNTFKFFKK
jgi:hypothetical protein